MINIIKNNKKINKELKEYEAKYGKDNEIENMVANKIVNMCLIYMVTLTITLIIAETLNYTNSKLLDVIGKLNIGSILDYGFVLWGFVIVCLGVVGRDRMFLRLYKLKYNKETGQ